jgi:hypothetical protein
MSFSEGDLRTFIHVGKHWVKRGDLVSLREAFGQLETQDIDMPTLFHRIYLHACLKKQTDIAEWMETTLFPTLCPIQQIGLRHIFPYGHRLLKK